MRDFQQIHPGDPSWPPLLTETPGAPECLYVSGDLSALRAPQIAIVGARNATPAGLANARAFARDLASAGLVITSGLALGIDGAAHRGAIEAGGRTVAVCGTGLDIVYPPRHRELAESIVEHGALVSEFPPGTPPRPRCFPVRNRIISALALGTLVVEAAPHSGSLITARLAANQGREVFAIPGSIHSPLSRGCHALIRDGAKLVESAIDVLDEIRQHEFKFPLPAASEQAARCGGGVHPPKPETQRVLAALGHDLLDADTVSERAGLPGPVTATLLLELELDGRVARLAGGNYQRLWTWI